jgi:hypothetical protein
MKRRDLDKMLHAAEFLLVRSTKHDIFQRGAQTIAIPRGKFVNPLLARRLVKEYSLA